MSREKLRSRGYRWRDSWGKGGWSEGCTGDKEVHMIGEVEKGREQRALEARGGHDS